MRAIHWTLTLILQTEIKEVSEHSINWYVL